MTRRSGVVVVAVLGIALVVVVLGLVRWMRDDRATVLAARSHAPGARSIATSATMDPRTATRGSIGGTVRDEAGAPIARARVCGYASSWQLPEALLRDPVCTTTDEQGRYRLANLFAADYAVHAIARTFRPEAFHATAGSKAPELRLAPGEARTGVDLVMRGGGVAVTGVVLDIAGGAIAHALVASVVGAGHRPGQSALGAAVETDEQGRFELWVAPGPITIHANAEGYTATTEWARAPCKLELLLTPASSLAGTVIDAATRLPVAGARVRLHGSSDSADATDVTDGQGRFRIAPLGPGRYTASATSENGYGLSEGSTQVGLAQHVEGVVIQLFPASRIIGTIVIAPGGRVCPDGEVGLHDPAHARRLTTRSEGDLQIVDGVRPGTYRVMVRCRDHASRDSYDDIEVRDTSITGLVWEVDEGARIRGKVVNKAGTPVEDAMVSSQPIGRRRDRMGFSRMWDPIRSGPDGSYQLTGLAPGDHLVQLGTESIPVPGRGVTVTVAAGATVERDLVVDDAGRITGTVVDETGAPVAGVQIAATGLDAVRAWGGAKADGDGAFTIVDLRPGTYRVAERPRDDEQRKPDDTAGETVSVQAWETATVRLVIAGRSGKITGTVVDASGAPVPDAFVAWAREPDASEGHSRIASTRDYHWPPTLTPVLTSPDGSFAFRAVPGTYSLRAFRKGGGEAFAEHVATGTTAKLQILPTASIEGTARRRSGAPVQRLTVTLRDDSTGYHRDEVFYRTGHFVVSDLPAGSFRLTVEADYIQRDLGVAVAPGQSKTGIDVMLDELVTVTGRVVEYGTRKPLAGIHVTAELMGHSPSQLAEDNRPPPTDKDGRFSISNVSPGLVTFEGGGRNIGGSNYEFHVVRRAEGTGTVEIGDLPAVRSRDSSSSGTTGLSFADPPADQLPEQWEYKIAWIDPAGPAANVGLEIGDVITTCDGVDILGLNSGLWWTLSYAAPGTKLVLGTRRGTRATIVLAVR